MTSNHQFSGLPPKSSLTLLNLSKFSGRTEIGRAGEPIIFWPDNPEIEKEAIFPSPEGILHVAGIPEKLAVVNIHFCCEGRNDHLVMDRKPEVP